MKNLLKYNLDYYSLSILLVFLGITVFMQCSTLDLGKRIDNTYSMTLGDLEEPGFQELITRLQNVHQYQIERNDVYGNRERYLRTYWKRSPAFSNNPNNEAELVETRITLTTRSRSTQGYRLYRVEFEGEYRALLPTESGVAEYQNTNLPKEAEEYFEDIAYDLKDQVQGVIRGY